MAASRAPASAGASMATRLAALGIAAAAIDLGGVYLKAPLGPPGVTLGDWIAGCGAYLLIAMYAWVAAGLVPSARQGVGSSARQDAGPPARLDVPSTLFFAAIVTYALGNGIHVAANSIHDMLDKTGVGDPWKLAYFWDETAGHYLVDAARIGFAVSLAWMEAAGRGSSASGVRGAPAVGGGIASASTEPAAGGRLPILVGAVSYGFIYFATAVEGQTVPLALPFVVLFAGWGLWRSRAEAGGRAPVRAFYTAAALISLALFAVWGVWHHGFPEFSRTGFIP